MRTVVLNKRRRELRIQEGPPDAFRYVYLLATEGHPWLVFEYEAEVGVIALFNDSTRQFDYASVARKDGFEAQVLNRDYERMTTERSFGACRLF
ncbi:hypothetical protein IQ225_19385 [Synechocystis salina LEGE 06155]|nr:hypothetical protein [Synechocystis salina LEGE 06155]